MWVQLCTIQYIDVNGRQETRHPGDWVNVGKQQAKLWLSRGDAIIPSGNGFAEFAINKGAGVLVRGGANALQQARAELEPFAKDLEIVSGDLSLPYKRTMLWNSSARLRRELVPLGFGFLETWQLAMPLLDYKILAANVGSEQERQRTQAVVRDLRIPLYDTRVIFARRCDETERLFERWVAELENGGDERLAFLRALYATPLLVLALPVTWMDIHER